MFHREREVERGPARSETPSTYRTFLHGNREVHCFPAVNGLQDASERQGAVTR